MMNRLWQSLGLDESNMNDQQKIGYLIREIRQSKGVTQQQFANALATSQSAVARMEKGDQNFSVKELSKISQALEHPLVTISDNVTDDYIIKGGQKLSGSIATNTSKNGGLVLMCASLLNRGTTILHRIPRIQEIFRMIEVFESIDIEVKWINEKSLKITPPKELNMSGLAQGPASKMRSVIMLIGSLIHRVDDLRLPHAGGCRMGDRTISAHRKGLEGFGVSIVTEEESYHITAANLQAAKITMYEASDTGTENVLMAAAGIKDSSYIHFATQNYMVQDLMGFLRKIGVKIEQTDPITLKVTGVGVVDMDVEYSNSEDPIESMAFLTAGIVTNSKMTVTGCPIDFLRLELLKCEAMGQKFTISNKRFSDNGFTKLVDIDVHPSELTALAEKIHPLPYPGINVDNLPFFVPIATQAEGRTLIHDWMWENRAIYFTELNRLGAQVDLADPHRAYIQGKTPLRAAQIVCPPALRPSVIILLAMMAAEGTSTLRNVYSIKRGYEAIDERLNAIGADIRNVSSLTG